MPPDAADLTSQPLTHRDFLILFALTEGPRHGYGLLKDVARLTDNEVKFDPANLYRSLKRMIEKDLVTESVPRSEADQELTAADTTKRRRYYAITEHGMRLVRAEATRMDRLAQAARDRNLIPETDSR